jgi:hypothetical protein
MPLKKYKEGETRYKGKPFRTRQTAPLSSRYAFTILTGCGCWPLLSMRVTVFLALLVPWGTPFFFLIAGTGSWFALRRRTAGQYTLERTKRLLVPYVAGCILLWPIMLHFQWRYLALPGGWYGSFWRFVLLHLAGFSPMWFGLVGPRVHPSRAAGLCAVRISERRTTPSSMSAPLPSRPTRLRHKRAGTGSPTRALTPRLGGALRSLPMLREPPRWGLRARNKVCPESCNTPSRRPVFGWT